VKFYPGVSFGGSYLAGNNKIAGVQFGLFGLLTFGENWNAMGELKYVHRFNSGSTLQDNYYQIDSSGGAGNTLQSKVNHFFKFSTLQSIEMPLALRYAAGRINLFTGVNMAYNFRVNVEEIKIHADTFTLTAAPNWSNSSPTASYSDFGPRFSLGYLLGAGWAVTPALQLDLRMTKNVWDNASGKGAELVSRQLYRAPSFQVSLFYRFSQRNQIPKAK
jgi:predicted porin